jgi:hypothetical protein
MLEGSIEKGTRSESSSKRAAPNLKTIDEWRDEFNKGPTRASRGWHMD